MDQNVAIVSYGLLNYKGPNELGLWNDEATFIVARQALEQVGLKKEDIDVVVIASMDGLDGITISNGMLVPAAGAYERDSIRIENSTLQCVMSGMASILSGNAEVVVVASSDMIEFDYDYITNANQDPFFRGPVGLNARQGYSLLAMDYLRKSKATEADFARVAAKNYLCGSRNRFAHVRNAYSKEEILASPLVGWPLHRLEIRGMSNGAGAFVLASEKKARELTDSPVWIKGIAAATNSYLGSWEELSSQRALKLAAKKSYQMAGIKDPGQDLDFMEVFNPFSAYELMVYEALGICSEGQGCDLLREGLTYPDGGLPVNLSGGSLCTNGPNSSGVFRTIQAVMLLRNEGLGEEGGNLGNLRRGLVHDGDVGIGAVGGDSHAVMILEREG
jgi:acetyl-CoA C-acetyltransferase